MLENLYILELGKWNFWPWQRNTITIGGQNLLLLKSILANLEPWTIEEQLYDLTFMWNLKTSNSWKQSKKWADVGKRVLSFIRWINSRDLGYSMMTIYWHGILYWKVAMKVELWYSHHHKNKKWKISEMKDVLTNLITVSIL